MQAARQAHTAAGLTASLRLFGQGVFPNLWPELHRLAPHTLLLTGGEDTRYTQIAQHILQAVPAPRQASLTHCAIEGAGHMPHLEAPQASAQAITDFLTKTEKDFDHGDRT
jgi:2-succinyl-6-hydroxy-2,4-cyclohexadiene-1-carboxylate synthase